MDILKEIGELKREHRYCEDPWYSCPFAEEGCCNESVDKTKCNCGAEEHNAKVDKIVAELKRRGIEEGKE